jgi:uncharacterized protein YdaU (DUF1376 family)
MTRRPSMQFYTSDWLGGTSLMSCTARGAYITMLATSWEQGPIPDTRTALFKAMGLGPDDPPFDQVWAEVQPKWTRTHGGCWVNVKLEHVREQRDAYCEAQAAKGRKGGRPPKAGRKPEVSELKPGGYEKPKAGGKPDESSPTPTPTPIFRSPDPSPDPLSTPDRAEHARALPARNDVPHWKPHVEPDQVAELMALGSQTGIELQRFVLERTFIQQIVFSTGDEQCALSYVRDFVEWAVDERRRAPGETPRDPAKWWRDQWAYYQRPDVRARVEPNGAWRDECDIVHGGTNGSACENRSYHDARTDAENRSASTPMSVR